jgi:competence protein ComEC
MRFWSLSFLVLIGFNFFVWHQIFSASAPKTVFYFLDVGQGDSELIDFAGKVQLLVDGGPDKKALFELANALPAGDRYLDLVAITHPQKDHFGGLYEILGRYRVGAILLSGREGQGSAWEALKNLIEQKKIPVVFLGAGDRIQYRQHRVMVLAPDGELLQDKEINNSSLVFKIESQGVKALLTGDIAAKAENYLVDKADINVDLLKVPHHGSKTSSSPRFVSAVSPAVSVIGVGEKNIYGHPHNLVLQRLEAAGSRIYRTDRQGTIKITAQDGIMEIFPSR